MQMSVNGRREGGGIFCSSIIAYYARAKDSPIINRPLFSSVYVLGGASMVTTGRTITMTVGLGWHYAKSEEDEHWLNARIMWPKVALIGNNDNVHCQRDEVDIVNVTLWFQHQASI